LEKQLEDPVAYRKEQEAKAKSGRSTDPFHQSLSDTHPTGRMSPEDIRQHLQLQLSELQKARQSVQNAKEKLSGEARQFFSSNLESQLEILLGLGHWLEACIDAKLAADEEDLPGVIAALTKAQTAFDTITSAQKLSTYGKWKDWYRGDKKMNLPKVKQRTAEILELAVS
jgi:hypothetical protein